MIASPLASLILGIIGMFLILLGFVLDEFVSSWRQNTFRYNLINLFGSSLLIIYAFSIKGIPFIILNSVWFVGALIKIFALCSKKKKRTTPKRKLKK